MKKEQVRQLFPQACKMADELRDLFGSEVKLTHLKEGERELGKPGERGVTPSVRGDFFVDKSKRRGTDV